MQIAVNIIQKSFYLLLCVSAAELDDLFEVEAVFAISLAAFSLSTAFLTAFS